MDVTEQRSSSERATQLAKYDALTGLPNRRRMAELLDTRLAGAEHHHRPCAVMLIDLDRFKQVNDTLGHPAGDDLLKQVAERLPDRRGQGKGVRLGGDEFQVIIPDCDDRGKLGELAQRSSTCRNPIRSKAAAHHRHSLGIAIAPDDGPSPTS